jgi:hypothetical protein
MILIHSFRAVLAALTLAAAAPAQDYEQFVKDFRQALAANDAELMTSLVKRDSVSAAWHVDEVCTALSESPMEEIEREAQALVAAWNAAHQTSFASNYYEYLSLIRPEERRERTRLVGAYKRALGTFNANTAGAMDGTVCEQVAAEMEGLAGGFQTLGDHYQAGNCWRLRAMCFDMGYRKETELDPVRAAEAYGKAIEAYDKVDIQHSIYVAIKERRERLEGEAPPAGAEGAAAPSPAGGEAAAAGAAVAGTKVVEGTPLKLALSFEAVEAIDQFARPNYFADVMYQSWPWLFFGTKGGAGAEFPAHNQRGPLLTRVAASEIALDADRDGKGEDSIRLTGKLAPVECQLTADGPARTWAFAMITGIASDRYQGLAYYLEPLDLFFYAFYVGAGSMLGVLGETEVRVIDENCDGLYGGQPLTWQYFGLTEGHFHPEFDSLVIGDSERAIPWSEFVQVPQAEGSWYRLEALDAGTVLAATPVTLETGRLVLDFEGPPVSWLVVRGEGQFANSYFDLLAGGKEGVAVPAGSYVLYAGEVRKGKNQQAAKALILPPSTPLRWTVAAGAKTTVELGGPFGYDFKATRSQEGVTVLGKSVVVIGARGERYERPWNCVARPEASVRKQGQKKGSTPERMEAVLDLMALDDEGKERYGLGDAWFPLDTTLQFVGEAYEVQLSEKRHELFGKVESAWK